MSPANLLIFVVHLSFRKKLYIFSECKYDIHGLLHCTTLLLSTSLFLSLFCLNNVIFICCTPFHLPPYICISFWWNIRNISRVVIFSVSGAIQFHYFHSPGKDNAPNDMVTQWASRHTTIYIINCCIVVHVAIRLKKSFLSLFFKGDSYGGKRIQWIKANWFGWIFENKRRADAQNRRVRREKVLEARECYVERQRELCTTLQRLFPGRNFLNNNREWMFVKRKIFSASSVCKVWVLSPFVCLCK